MSTVSLLSETAVASMAAGLLDDFHLDDINEDTPIGRFMSREFGFVRDEVLQSYPWHPAVKRASLPQLSTAPAFGWAYAYQLPDDCLRLHPLRASGYLDGASISHEVEDGQVLTDEPGPLLIRYTYRLTNISKWRPLMGRVLAARLAMYAATRVTGKLQYFEKAQSEYARVLWEAQHADSMERGTTETYVSGGGFDQGADVFSVRGLS